MDCKRLAQVIVEHSLGLKPGERVLMDYADVPQEMVLAMARAVHGRGAQLFLEARVPRVERELLLCGTPEYWQQRGELELARIQKTDAYVALRGAHNSFETADVPQQKMKVALSALKPSFDWRVNKTRWVVLRWPTPSMAQQAGMSTEAFEAFFSNVCTLDYAALQPGMEALKARMEKTDQVRIVGPGTDLHFSIKNIPAIVCCGTHNLPDGEVFTAPIRDSVQGVVQYNTPTLYQGKAFDHVRLCFKDGRIIEASASNNTQELNAILDTDSGARYIGEFALGVNPAILEPMRDILFDEKIAGSFHFTPGQAYEQADNGNRSQVHWDLVCIQRPEYGGGSIYFDDRLVRKDGMLML